MSDSDFIFDEKYNAEVHVAGAYLKNEAGEDIAGMGVVFNLNHPLNFSGPVEGPAIENVAEIQAYTKAISLCHAAASMDGLNAFTSSMFLIQVVQEWLPRFEMVRFWGIPVANHYKPSLNRLVRAIDTCSMDEIIIDYTVHENALTRMAHQLAENGARQYRTN